MSSAKDDLEWDAMSVTSVRGGSIASARSSAVLAQQRPVVRVVRPEVAFSRPIKVGGLTLSADRGLKPPIKVSRAAIPSDRGEPVASCSSPSPVPPPPNKAPVVSPATQFRLEAPEFRPKAYTPNNNPPSRHPEDVKPPQTISSAGPPIRKEAVAAEEWGPVKAMGQNSVPSPAYQKEEKKLKESEEEREKLNKIYDSNHLEIGQLMKNLDSILQNIEDSNQRLLAFIK